MSLRSDSILRRAGRLSRPAPPRPVWRYRLRRPLRHRNHVSRRPLHLSHRFRAVRRARHYSAAPARNPSPKSTTKGYASPHRQRHDAWICRPSRRATATERACSRASPLLTRERWTPQGQELFNNLLENTCLVAAAFKNRQSGSCSPSRRCRTASMVGQNERNDSRSSG